MNKIFTQLLEFRHIDDDFLHPKYENLADPFSLNDMDKAVNRIEKSLKNNEKILIYGDYDVDGITAATLMEDTLILAGVKRENLEIMLPDRFLDGYGMSERLVERAKNNNIGLVITVDCGSRNHDIIKELKTTKIDTIITDHHECENTLPDAIAVINPKRKDYSGPKELRDLAGVGVAFKLSQALVNKKIIKNGQEKWLLDLVLLGTICDQMIQTKENRILCYYGIKVLEKTRRNGLKELIQNASVNKITSEAIGFGLGPRLNAAGRLETAELSLDLLRCHSSARAAAIAAKLESLNRARRNEQRAAVAEIDNRGISKTPVIVEKGHWHEGIIGIVAGRLVENYHRPAFVLTETEPGILKGSGRSFGDFSLAEALEQTKDIIISGGGHAAAAGVRLKSTDFEQFCYKINNFYDTLHLDNQERFFAPDPDLTLTSLDDFTLNFLDDLKLLEPFGPGNKEPIFRLTGATVLEIHHMGDKGQHLRLDLKSSDGKILKCVAFSAPEKWFTLQPEDICDYFIQPIDNEFRGVRSLEARLLSIDFL